MPFELDEFAFIGQYVHNIILLQLVVGRLENAGIIEVEPVGFHFAVGVLPDQQDIAA